MILNLGNTKVTDVHFGQVTSNWNGLHLESNLPNHVKKTDDNSNNTVLLVFVGLCAYKQELCVCAHIYLHRQS